MSVFKVNNISNGMVREGGVFLRTSGADEIRQGVQVRLQVIRGEIPWNLRLGFPWIGPGGLLSKGVPPELIESRLRARITDSPGVVDVNDLALTEEGDRRASVRYTAAISVPLLREDLLVEDTVTVQT